MPIQVECNGGPLDGGMTEIIPHDFWTPLDGKGKIYTKADPLNSSDRLAHYRFDQEKGKYVHVKTESTLSDK